MKNAFDYPYCRFQIIAKVITYKDMLKESAKQSAVSALSAKAPFQCPIAQVPECLECLSAQASFEFPSAQVPKCPKYPGALTAGVLTCPTSALSALLPKYPSNALSAQGSSVLCALSAQVPQSVI